MPGEANGKNGDLKRIGPGEVKGGAVTVRQGGAESISAEEVTIRQGGAVSVQAERIRVTQGGIALASAEKIRVTAGTVGAFVADRVRLEQVAASVVAARESVALDQSMAGVAAGTNDDRARQRHRSGHHTAAGRPERPRPHGATGRAGLRSGGRCRAGPGPPLAAPVAESTAEGRQG